MCLLLPGLLVTWLGPAQGVFLFNALILHSCCANKAKLNFFGAVKRVRSCRHLLFSFGRVSLFLLPPGESLSDRVTHAWLQVAWTGPEGFGKPADLE